MSYIMYYIMYNSMFNMWLFHFASLVDFTLVLCVLYRISIYADTTLAVTRSLLGPISCTVTYCIWQYLTCVWRSLGSIIWVSLFIPRDNSGEKIFSMLLEIIPIPSMPSENIPSSLVLVFDSSHATTVMFQLDIYVCTIRCCITVGLFHPWGHDSSIGASNSPITRGCVTPPHLRASRFHTVLSATGHSTFWLPLIIGE